MRLLLCALVALFVFRAVASRDEAPPPPDDDLLFSWPEIRDENGYDAVAFVDLEHRSDDGAITDLPAWPPSTPRKTLVTERRLTAVMMKMMEPSGNCRATHVWAPPLEAKTSAAASSWASKARTAVTWMSEPVVLQVPGTLVPAA